MFRSQVIGLFQTLRANPSSLEERHPEMKKRLDAMCGKGQGLGNKASDQEACFAVIAEQHGFSLYVPNTDGYFYKYQIGGTQRALDFQLLEVKNGLTIDFINLDLKHGDAEGIFLNDGTFLDDVVYVISFSRNVKVEGQRRKQKQHVCAILLGQDVMTNVDKQRMADWQDFIDKKRKEMNDGDFLILYPRSANRYDCRQFTDVFLEEKTALLTSWLLPSLPQTEQEPHSQSV